MTGSAEHVVALKDLSIEAEVDIWESLDGHDGGALAPYHLLFVGGGSTSTLAEQVLRHDFVSAVCDFVAAGGRYCGGSAGALLACETLTIASLVDGDIRATRMRGLGLVENLSVFPHADTFPKNRPLEVARALGHDILALPEASGVAVEGSGFRAIGPDPVRLVTNAGHDVREMRAGERAEARARRPVSPDAEP
ncbi:MAG: peptidase E [Intrasporangium sp.]|uniref:Type 1 glutamine amidotransferase-like domain-containing protein n=1 Tax=Intrasporangium sp. TaxID=1925024 RepID=UPI002648DF14|nr:Type 1 glutamine amidotransferase-like domain-containing protein [Intrasporangium sp.]MDN5798343.1 peptidase E [Intrasporangium sp.]